MADESDYNGLREGYVLLPFPPDKQLNPRDIDWKIEAQLGRGNFGQVVRGTWKGKPSALKIANPNNGQEAIDLLMEEATMMMYVPVNQQSLPNRKMIFLIGKMIPALFPALLTSFRLDSLLRLYLKEDGPSKYCDCPRMCH